MSFAGSYFEKHKFLVPHIQEPPPGLLQYIVVIPAYLEENAEATLESLLAAKKPKDFVEVIVVVNFPVSDSPENKTKNIEIYKYLMLWCERNSSDKLRFHTFMAADLPKKHAGAGLARKIGMDEALHRFSQVDNSTGLIISLDADTLVDKNYFVSLEEAQRTNAQAGGFIFSFEHPLAGSEFSEEVYKAIALYELHLRYYKHALAYSGFPYAFYTIGSCFAVRAGFYAEQGGMNRRQAGEDFYFLNKLFPHRDFKTVRNTCVYPSARESDRVPFGTGPSIKEIISKGGNYETYSPKAFAALKQFFDELPQFYSASVQELESMHETLPAALTAFVKGEEFILKLKEIKQHTASPASFSKRFYQWFDAFRVVKFLNFAHQSHFLKTAVPNAVEEFFGLSVIESGSKTSIEQLMVFRQLDKEGKSISN